MDTTPIERSLRSAETGTLVVDSRLVARVIKRHRRIVGIGLQVPHASCYALGRDDLLALVPAAELGEAGAKLPEHVVLLPRPKGSEILAASPAEVLTRLWRGAFHGHVHLALEAARRRGALDEAGIRARIDRIGQTEFDEIRRVLRSDDLLLPPADDAEVYTEFAALLLELHHFAPRLVARTFPTLRDTSRALVVIGGDVDARALLAACRPEGAADPTDAPLSRESTTPTYSALPALDVLPAFLSRRATTVTGAQKLVVQAEKARAEGNHVRAALSLLAAMPAAGEDQQVKLRAQVQRDLDALGARLDSALVGPGESAESAPRVPWTSSLMPLAATASERQALRYPVEARLLYDLQRACVAHERGSSAVDLVTWALSLGKRPIVRKLPATRALKVARHLRSALQKLRHVEMPSADRRLIARLLRMAVRRAEENVRKTLRPVLEGTLDGVGLRPASVPEHVARKKLVEELCDQVVARGFLSIGQLRDALSRNQLKMGDVAHPRELVRGDPLLLADRALDVALDGVYRRGEVYLRALQKVSSVFFGTKLGRLVTLFVILPAGGAFVVLEGLQHMVGPAAKALGFVPPHLVSTPSLLVTTAVIFGLIHSEALRAGVMRLLSMLGHALAAVFVRLPRWVLSLGPIRRVLESGLARALARYVLMPLVVAAILYMATPLRDVPGVIGPLGAAGVFVAASVLLNTRAGLVAQEVVFDQIALGWEALKGRALPGLLRLVMGIFRAMLELSERTLYRVDEFLRFREGDKRATIPLKAALGLVWFLVAYVIRLYITLLIEPEINPVKHFPVVTVAQKMLIQQLAEMLTVMNHALAPLGPVIGGTIAATTVFLFPSVFGFLVWEFKENFRLYRENRAKNLGPVPIGHQGETVGTLMRPGFHSGTLPKLYGKLRRAARRADLDESRGIEHGHGSLRGLQEQLDDLRETVRRAVDREVSGLLAACPRFRAGAITVQSVELGSNRLRLELACDALSKAKAVIAFEEQSGLVVASVTEPGFVDALDGADRILFENAIAGFYRMAGVDLVREQIRAALGDDVPYDIADEGLVLWPGEGYRTEVIYPLDAAFSGPIVPPTVRGDRPATPPKPLDLRKILFRDQHIPWAEWALSWREEVAGEAPRRVLFGASILPPPRLERERAARLASA
ncbi:hypothetical protein [Polyangium fumosum]|uniref:hypothetical protein n=1 Tax=Polyangium fumosum TaxID=889272 RepID=UPI0014794A94|nr:hypothetical protein [Polyangium fumosum]